MYRAFSRFCRTQMQFYAVKRGRKPGVYTTWSECENQVKGFSNARYKKFATETEAWSFIESTDASASTTQQLISAEDGKTKIAASTSASNTVQCESQLLVKTLNSRKRSAILLPFEEITAAKSSRDSVEVFTDGCCLANGKGNPRAGIGVYWGPGHANNLAERLPGRQTNNRAEIYAAVRAVQQAKTGGFREIVIYTDSQFLINCQTKWMSKWKKNGWKLANGSSVTNREELELLDVEQAGIRVTYVHVKGHDGIEGNEAADRLANLGAAKDLEPSSS